MTNTEKFIEVMNKYFDAGLTEENLQNKKGCTPCGVFRVGACESSSCDGCASWWGKEWKPKGDKAMSEKVLPIPCTKVEEKTVKNWFSKINEELDELKEAIPALSQVGAKYLFKDALGRLDCKLWAHSEAIAEEAADVITAITSMLEAMGIDENMRQAAQRRVNEKNKERGRF